jgi:hypothetical protein
MESSTPDPTARLVSLSDGVFGFALTLLVFPFETPTKFAQVLDFIRLGLAYALGAALIALIWWEHNRFFKLYRDVDAGLVALNVALLFCLLLFVYPLKFLAVFLETWFLGLSNQGLLGDADVPALMLVYGLSFAALNLLLYALHRYARWRFGLPFSPSGRIEARTAARTALILGSVALLSVAVVGLALLIRPNALVGWMVAAGLVYNLYLPLFLWSYSRQARELQKLATF